MDASEAKGDHGGIHEAAIGVGNCRGPALGAAPLLWVPQYAPTGGAVAVSVLLLCGLGGLVGIWKTARIRLTQRRKGAKTPEQSTPQSLCAFLSLRLCVKTEPCPLNNNRTLTRSARPWTTARR